jgi:hypothetical protein
LWKFLRLIRAFALIRDDVATPIIAPGASLSAFSSFAAHSEIDTEQF